MTGITVRQVMTTDVITVQTTTSIPEVIEILSRHRINAVPVLDERGQLAGIISESDLLPQEKTIPFTNVKATTLFSEYVDPEQPLQCYEHADQHTADQAMTKGVVSVNPGDDLEQVARVLASHQLRQAPVVEQGALVGIISRKDILKVLGAENR